MGFRQARIRSGLTQEQVAERLGVSRQTINLWENGKRIPSGFNLIQAAHLLEVTAEELIRDEHSVGNPN